MKNITFKSLVIFCSAVLLSALLFSMVSCAKKKPSEPIVQKPVVSAEDEARKRTEEEARLKAEDEARAKAKRRADEEARLKAEEEVRLKAEEEARKKAEAKAAEEDARLREAEAKRMLEEEAAKRREDEARRKFEEERLKAAEAAKAEEDARKRAEEETRLKAEEETRARAAEKAKAAAEAGGKASHEVVKGESLWKIAKHKDVYKNPFMWPLIYKANHDKINDPDMIYPKQILSIPREFSSGDKDKATHHAKTRGEWSLHDGPEKYWESGYKKK